MQIDVSIVSIQNGDFITGMALINECGPSGLGRSTNIALLRSEDKRKYMKTRILSILLLALLTCSAAAKTRLPFTNDDYNKALTLAKQRKLPLFVEVWAPW